MRFLIDAQLPPSLAATLREHGHEAIHVFDLLPPNARDQVIWPLAIGGAYILVTKDEDFAEWSRLRQPAPPVLWLRIGNLKKTELRAKLAPLLPELVQRLQAGETLIEVF
jgi:predicted nuclease of predicted toxin-antitoxin system